MQKHADCEMEILSESFAHFSCSQVQIIAQNVVKSSKNILMLMLLSTYFFVTSSLNAIVGD